MSMIETAAVIAHFDPENKLDPTFRILVNSLRQICDLVIIVTTCQLESSEIPADAQIVIIERPNIGYDFYSYRVGVNEVMRRGGTERLFLLNSSFLILDQHLFVEMLRGMIEGLTEVSIIGCTESFQWLQHIQSYLLLFRADAISSSWFQKWMQIIEPQNSKLETIITGEFGLAGILKENGVVAKPFFNLTEREKLRAGIAWMIFIAKNQGFIAFVRSLRLFSEFNPVHFAAQPLAQRCGIAKTELLRDNPCQISLNWLPDVTNANERETIARYVEVSRQHYKHTGNGLTVFETSAKAIPAFRLISTGPLARPGVKVAVVLHLFYPELINEIREYLRNILDPFDLFVTTPHEGAIPTIFNKFGHLAQTVAVVFCENRGRDIGPFVALYRQKMLESYDAVLKVHGKRSTYSQEGSFWRHRLFKELCGNYGIVLKTLELIRKENAGIVGPHADYLTHEQYWGANRKSVGELLKLSGVNISESPKLGFFAGSMFWFKPKAIAPLHTIPEEHLVFEEEAGMQDGTLAHAIERIFCSIARNEGYNVTSMVLAGVDILNTDTEANSVPVL